MLQQVNFTEAKELLKAMLPKRLVPFLSGSPGIGKSSLMQELADEFNLKLIDFRLSQADPTDLNGFPFIDPATGKAKYVPMDTFPIEGDELPFTGRMEDDPQNPGKQRKVLKQNSNTGVMEPERYDGWLLFLDEFNSASLSVQKATYKLVLDHMVGQHKLHPRVLKVCAGNLSTDNAIVARLSTAMQSRLIHLQMRSDKTEWLKWANANQVDFRITSFINFKPESLNMFQEMNKNNSIESTFPCERTWHFMDKLLKTIQGDFKDIHKIMFGGAIGEGMAAEFVGFTRVFHDLPSIDDIIKNPNSAKLPTTPDCQYAVTGLVGSNMVLGNVDALVTYANRLASEFTFLTLHTAVQRNKSLIDHPKIEEWINTNASELT